MASALISTSDAAELLGNMHPETIRRLYRAGRIPGYRVGRYLRFDPDEVREALRSEPSTAVAGSVSATPDFDALDRA